MKFEFIEGFREGCRLLWIPNEKHLYAKKNYRNNKTEYICYQSILCASTSSEGTVDRTKCTARRFIDADSELSMNSISHTIHENHQQIYNDLKSLKSMKKVCTFLKKNVPISSRKISEKEIYSQIKKK